MKSTIRREKGNTFCKRFLYCMVTLFIFGIIIWMSAEHDRNMEKSENEAISEVSGITEFAVKVDSGLADSKIDDISKISWYFKEDEWRYYLFLPSMADMEHVILDINGKNEIFIDEVQKVKNGENFSITEGAHVVSTSDGYYYPIIVMKSENLKTVMIHTKSGNLDYINELKGNHEEGSAIIYDGNGQKEYLGKLEELRGRGNATWFADKPAYQIKLANKTDLFEMGKAKKWILLANFWDDTMLRNYVAYETAREAGMEFVCESVFADLYINNEYYGIYQLCEKVEIDKERINITDLSKATEKVNGTTNLEQFPQVGIKADGILEENVEPLMKMAHTIPKNPSDITGGYILEIDWLHRLMQEESGFVTRKNQAIHILSPSIASKEQVDYISELYQEFEDAAFSIDGINAKTGKTYDEYINMESFAKKYLIEEIAKNQDAVMSSQFIYKYPDNISKKFYAGPVWDYDIAFGNGDISERPGIVDFRNAESLFVMGDWEEKNIWHALYFKTSFFDCVMNNYFNNIRGLFLQEAYEKIDMKASELESSIIMDRVKWKGYRYEDEKQVLDDYRNSVYFLKKFIVDRITFLDATWS